MDQERTVCVFILLLIILATGCSRLTDSGNLAATIISTPPTSVPQTSHPTATPTVTLVPSLTPTSTQTPTATPSPTPVIPADVIFYNGTLLTIEDSQPIAEAIAIRDGLIQAVGTDDQILSLQVPDTKMVDLGGKTLMPGFIDGHTHMLNGRASGGKTLDEAQYIAIRFGLTTVNEMTADQGFIDTLMQAEQDGSLHLRVNVFPTYNNRANHQIILLKVWFPEHSPILDPEKYLRIPGIKIFVDGSSLPVRGCWAVSEPFLPGGSYLSTGVCGTELGDLYWSQEDLNKVVSDAQAAGYRVAFHAMGDRAIETALNAIEYAIKGQSNENYRHQIEHNSLVRPDLLPRYEEMGVLASVRGYAPFCDLQFLVPNFGPERYTWYVNRYVLPSLDIHAYIETDFTWIFDPDNRFAYSTLDPIVHLYGLVTHRSMADDGSFCEPDPLVAPLGIRIERALQMLTIEPAYAVSMEDYIGSLKPGKYADLILLSDNPLSVEPDSLKDLSVWMTMIGGKVEYCATGHESLCP